MCGTTSKPKLTFFLMDKPAIYDGWWFIHLKEMMDKPAIYGGDATYGVV